MENNEQVQQVWTQKNAEEVHLATTTQAVIMDTNTTFHQFCKVSISLVIPANGVSYKYYIRLNFWKADFQNINFLHKICFQ